MPDSPDSTTPMKDTATPYARLSAVEIAAKRGFGPLSDSAAEVWHGDARPCVSCGELCRRNQHTCPHCGQDLSPSMVQKMAAYAGPWYVHEHVRPFPGVTLERLVRQARRGVLTTTTIVRGPSTHHQWRFAAETPGLAHHLGVCWSCQTPVSDQTYSCATCGALQESEPTAAPAAPLPTGSPLDQIQRAVTAAPEYLDAAQPRSGFRLPMPLVIFILIAITIAGLLFVVQRREQARGTAAERPAAGAVKKTDAAPAAKRKIADTPQDEASARPSPASSARPSPAFSTRPSPASSNGALP